MPTAVTPSPRAWAEARARVVAVRPIVVGLPPAPPPRVAHPSHVLNVRSMMGEWQSVRQCRRRLRDRGDRADNDQTKEGSFSFHILLLKLRLGKLKSVAGSCGIEDLISMKWAVRQSMCQARSSQPKLSRRRRRPAWNKCLLTTFKAAEPSPAVHIGAFADSQRSTDPLLFTSSARADSQRRWLPPRKSRSHFVAKWMTCTICC